MRKARGLHGLPKVSVALLLALLTGCHEKHVTITPKLNAWFIDSWDNGIVTAQHDGYTYKATCDISRSFHNAESVTDEHNVYKFQTCDLALGLVGQSVQSLEGKQRDSDGWVVVMWNAGSILALRSWKDEHTPWRLEEFTITSVKKHYD